MNLPRLIIADEHRPGKLPAGVLIASSLVELGYNVRLFVGNVDETTLRTLQVLCNRPVTLLDPILCESQSNLRWLFQQAASPDCINLILTNLGGRWSEDSPFRISRECKLLSEWLDCELIPVIYSDTSSVIAVRTISEIIKDFEMTGASSLRLHGIVFRSVLNSREFELLDREVGRQLIAVSMGSIPKLVERDQPMLTSLCTENYRNAVLTIRSAVMQLKMMDQQINWAALAALAQVDDGWSHQPRLVSPISEAGKVNIAVIRHPALTLGGDGTEHLMRALGCNVVDIPLDGNVGPNVPIHGVYIPHGLGYMTLKYFYSNLYAKTLIGRGTTGGSFMLAEGGSAPILGDKITLPAMGQGGGGQGKGFGILPYSSVYSAPTFRSPQKMVATGRKKINPLISGSQEWVWGYASNSLQMEASNEEDKCWKVAESVEAAPAFTDGWAKGRMLATSLRIEPWSTPNTFRRWLEGE